MKAFLFVIFTLVFLILLIGCQSRKNESTIVNGKNSTSESMKVGVLKSMKGWELYSWQKPEGWYYALVVGTNRIKTFEEISANDVTVLGLEVLKAKLSQLVAGEEIYWSNRGVPNTQFPPEDVVNVVKTYCEACGLQLAITQ
jgi:hypothetical protein